MHLLYCTLCAVITLNWISLEKALGLLLFALAIPTSVTEFVSKYVLRTDVFRGLAKRVNVVSSLCFLCG